MTAMSRRPTAPAYPQRTSTRSVATSGRPASGDKLLGRVVARRRVVEMARTLSAIRWLTDGVRRPARVASERVCVLLDRPLDGIRGFCRSSGRGRA
jgi:hypothetical protein